MSQSSNSKIKKPSLANLIPSIPFALHLSFHVYLPLQDTVSMLTPPVNKVKTPCYELLVACIELSGLCSILLNGLALTRSGKGKEALTKLGNISNETIRLLTARAAMMTIRIRGTDF